MDLRISSCSANTFTIILFLSLLLYFSGCKEPEEVEDPWKSPTVEVCGKMDGFREIAWLRDRWDQAVSARKDPSHWKTTFTEYADSAGGTKIYIVARTDQSAHSRRELYDCQGTQICSGGGSLPDCPTASALWHLETLVQNLGSVD